MLLKERVEEEDFRRFQEQGVIKFTIMRQKKVM